MKSLLSEERFSFVPSADKEFIVAFDENMNKIGFDSGGEIRDGYCWGKYLISYSKTGTKTKKVAARIYIREKSTVLRLFLNKIDDHRQFIEKSPDYILEAFTGDYGRCKHCKNEKDRVCKFRKTYTLNEEPIEMCNGLTFEFRRPTTEKLPEYIRLFSEFYHRR